MLSITFIKHYNAKLEGKIHVLFNIIPLNDPVKISIVSYCDVKVLPNFWYKVS